MTIPVAYTVFLAMKMENKLVMAETLTLQRPSRR